MADRIHSMSQAEVIGLIVIGGVAVGAAWCIIDAPRLARNQAETGQRAGMPWARGDWLTNFNRIVGFAGLVGAVVGLVAFY